MTEKQYAYADYLLKRLGFEQGCKDAYFQLFKEQVYRKFYNSFEWDKNFDFSPVSVLHFENQMRKSKTFPKRKQLKKGLSATDLANFEFCPVAFSIQKSFHNFSNELTDRGTIEHNKQILLSLYNRENIIQPNETFESYINEKNSYFFEELKKSELIYGGHNEDNVKLYFENKEENFYSQPDYILKNSEEKYIVVEEKNVFGENYANNNGKDFFYRNHKIQLLSYIYLLKEYHIEYGYLVYWVHYYENDEDYYKVSKLACRVLKITRNEYAEKWLNENLKELKLFIRSQKQQFETKNLNVNKCANCGNILLCGHKNGKFSDVTFPYNEQYLKTYYTPYPEILKDKKNENE